jgi:hypothetical protein
MIITLHLQLQAPDEGSTRHLLRRTHARPGGFRLTAPALLLLGSGRFSEPDQSQGGPLKTVHLRE